MLIINRMMLAVKIRSKSLPGLTNVATCGFSHPTTADCNNCGEDSQTVFISSLELVYLIRHKLWESNDKTLLPTPLWRLRFYGKTDIIVFSLCLEWDLFSSVNDIPQPHKTINSSHGCRLSFSLPAVHLACTPVLSFTARYFTIGWLLGMPMTCTKKCWTKHEPVGPENHT